METVYTSAATAGHLAKFSLPPDQLDPDVWHRLLARADGDVTLLMEFVEMEMGIVPAPAHSDWINDVQPIWTDVTFLRLYFDVYPGISQHLPEGQPPYVLFDTIKCNRFPATEPNAALWDLLDESVRFQMSTYELDGFRVDIGHTLPPELLSRLFATMRKNRRHPVIISEDLFNRNHERARDTGYNIMLGSGWNVMADLSWARLRGHVAELPDLKIHVFACAETPDTPRITSRPGGIRLSRMMAVFNGFLPNGIPLINTGLEVNERQPLNCGLGDNTGGADIPRAFFNEMVIDWRADSAMFELLCATAQTRKRFADSLTAESFFLCDTAEPLVAFGFRSDSDGVVLLLLNLDKDGDVAVELADLVPDPVVEWDVVLDSAARKQQNECPVPNALHPQQAVIVHGRLQERIASVSPDINALA